MHKCKCISYINLHQITLYISPSFSLRRVLGQHVLKKIETRFGTPGEYGANVLVPAAAELPIRSDAALAPSMTLLL